MLGMGTAVIGSGIAGPCDLLSARKGYCCIMIPRLRSGSAVAARRPVSLLVMCATSQSMSH